MSLFGPYLAACMLLVVAGCAKATRPHDTARALVGLLPRLRFGLALLAVRTFALGETALGLFAIFLPGPVTAALVSGCYASFALVVAFLRHRDVPLSSCGCFAEGDTMPTGLHVAIDAGFALCAAVTSAFIHHDVHTIVDALAPEPLHGFPLLAASAGVAYLAALAMGPLARIESIRGEVLSHHAHNADHVHRAHNAAGEQVSAGSDRR